GETGAHRHQEPGAAAIQPATHRHPRQRGDRKPQGERARHHHARGAEVPLHGAEEYREAVEDDAPGDGLGHAERRHDDPAVVPPGSGCPQCGRARSRTASDAGAGMTGTSHAKSPVATAAPASWATMNAGTSVGRMPAKVSLAARAMVTAGFAKEVDAVNQ